MDLEGSWSIIDLLRASAEVWRDLADVEDDRLMAAGFLTMASDLERYATALDTGLARRRTTQDH